MFVNNIVCKIPKISVLSCISHYLRSEFSVNISFIGTLLFVPVLSRLRNGPQITTTKLSTKENVSVDLPEHVIT